MIGSRRARTLLLAVVVLAFLTALAGFQVRAAERAQAQAKPAPAPGQPIPNTYTPPAGTPGGPVPAVPDEGPLVAPGPAPDIIFDFTSRVVGFIEPCG